LYNIILIIGKITCAECTSLFSKLSTIDSKDAQISHFLTQNDRKGTIRVTRIEQTKFVVSFLQFYV
jgi:hypothetical protein